MSQVDGVDDGVGYGVRGTAGVNAYGTGLRGYSPGGNGVDGYSYRFIGVHGFSRSGHGVSGWSYNGFGVYGYSERDDDLAYAAYLDGRVFIRGPLSKPGGSFKIDHPLDPANKYLSHSFVE